MPRRRHPDHDCLVQRAVGMRLAGATAREIAAALGVGIRSVVIREATRVAPAAERTGRMRAKDDLRMQAIQLRLEAKTYDEIQAELGVSKGSLSLWLGNLTLPKEVRDALLEKRRVRVSSGQGGGMGRHHQALAEDETARLEAEQWLGALTERELVIATCVAYWCEGSKGKPWRHTRRVTFMNSDPGLVRLFLAGLAALGVVDERISLRMSIHENADIATASEVWASIAGVEVERLRRPTLKKHNPVTIRRNVDHEYIGCLSIAVHTSSGLYRRIQGVMDAVVARLPALATSVPIACALTESDDFS